MMMMARSRHHLLLALVIGLVAVAFAGDAAILLDERSGAFGAPFLDERSTADMIAHIMGIPPLHPKVSRANFPAANLFNRPNSNLIVTLDGVGTDTLSQLSASSVRVLKTSETSRVAHLNQGTPTSRSSIASVVTLMTGEEPATHGIYGRTWVSDYSTDEISAFNSMQTRVPTVADILLTALPESAVLVISSDRQLAGALAPHPQTLGNSRVFFYDREASSFVSLSGDVLLSRAEIIELAQSSALPVPDGGKLELRDGSVRFTLPNGVWVSYDLNTPQDLALFAELAAISKLVPELAAKRSGSSTACDLISIGVASIRALEERYGPSSFQVIGALYLVDAALVSVSEQLDSVYGSRTTRQTLLLGTSVMAANSQRSARAVLDDSSSTGSSTNTTYTEQQVADYQISIWASVVLVIVLIVPIYTFMTMDTSSDSILYRVAGPRLA